jgi:hypothetical protein
MYRDLAATAGLYYYRLPSDKPDNVSASMFYDKDFFDKCDGDERHISSPAAFLDYECNSRSKSSPVLLNLVKLRDTLELALDDIGCRDGFCHEGWNYKNCALPRARERALQGPSPFSPFPNSFLPQIKRRTRKSRKRRKKRSKRFSPFCRKKFCLSLTPHHQSSFPPPSPFPFSPLISRRSCFFQ